MSVPTTTDIAIVGGGIMGSALAYWIGQLDPGSSVTVIERDPTYARASSALSAASIRQQYTTAINIRIAKASLAFLREAHRYLAVDGSAPDLQFTERGYLYLAGPAGMPTLEAAHAIQRAAAADVALFGLPELAARFPWLCLDGLAGASYGLSGEGWFDGYGLLQAFIAKARSQGTTYRRGEVTGLALDGHRVRELELGDGSRLSCGFVVNAAGPWAAGVAALAGISLPVAARRRTVYVFSCPEALAGVPLLIDPSGFWIRPEGRGFIGALPPADDADELPLEPELDRFEPEFWPLVAARIPAFESLRLERAWAGYYEINTFDHNGLVGLHPTVDNLVFMNGFSGHGLQQAPVVGRGVAELILTGRYVTVDLGDLGIDRLLSNRPLHEINVIG